MSRGILLSGGMDSVALAYWQRPEIAFTVNYGQVCAQAEIDAAGEVAAAIDMEHEVITVDCRKLGFGDLAGLAPSVLGVTQEWWPYRNQLLITLAAMRGVPLGLTELMIGSVRSDSAFRDGTKNFVEHVDRLMSFQEGELRITAPAIEFTTAELVRKSEIPFDILAWAHSCHCADVACGDCRGCYKHQSTMEELGHGYY